MKFKSNLLQFIGFLAIVFTLATQTSFAAHPGKTITANATSISASTETISQLNAPFSADNSAPMEQSAGGKSQLVALLLCIFVGGLGIHRFYLGYTTIGIIQLLTAGGCGIWAIIDLIRIATGDLKPKNGSYDETL